MRPVKTRISLRSCSGWSESLLSAWRHFGSLVTTECSVKTLIRLRGCPIWVFAGCTLSCRKWRGPTQLHFKNREKLFLSRNHKHGAAAWKKYLITCASTEVSDQSTHTRAWSETWQGALSIVKEPGYLYADSKDSDQATLSDLSLRWLHMWKGTLSYAVVQ